MSLCTRTILAPVFAAIALCIASLLSFSADLRFDAVDSRVLENLGFEQGAKHWRVRGNTIFVRKGVPHTLVIPASKSIPYAGRLIGNPGQYRYLKVAVQARAVSLSGEQASHGGTVALLAYDAAGKRARYWPQRVLKLKDTEPWQAASAVLPVIPSAKRLFLVVYASGVSGFFEVREIEITALAEKSIFKALRGGLLIGWLALWIWITRALMANKHRSAAKVLAFALANLLLLAGVTPQPHLNDTLRLLLFSSQDVYFAGRDALTTLTAATADDKRSSDGPPEHEVARVDEQRDGGADSGQGATGGEGTAATATESAQTRRRDRPANEHRRADKKQVGTARSPREYWVPRWKDLDKTGHIFGFAVLALVVGFAYRQRRVATRLLSLAVVAASIQTLQLYSVTREPDLSDLRADLIGVILGTLIAAVLLRMLRPLMSRAAQAG